MKILVTGGNGVMGTALREFLPDAIYLGRADLDVTDDRQLNEVFQREQPEVVIHAAAITDHQHPNASEIIETNIIGTQYVTWAARKVGAKVVYLSTHYVYPGKTGDYRETDRPLPIGLYAWSKLAGEAAVFVACNPNYLIIRGSWYTIDKVCAWAKSGAFVDAVTNREPTYEAAQKIATLVRLGASGIYNIGGDRTTFFNIAANEWRATIVAFVGEARMTSRTEHKGTYPFPADSSVNTDKYDALVGV